MNSNLVSPKRVKKKKKKKRTKTQNADVGSVDPNIHYSLIAVAVGDRKFEINNWHGLFQQKQHWHI